MVTQSRIDESVAAIGSTKLSALPDQLVVEDDSSGKELLATRTADPWAGLRERREDYRAVVNASSVVSFVQGLSSREKSDVLDSVQFAERAANAKFDRGDQIQDWYECYVEILGKLGWVVHNLAFDRKDHSEGKFRMSQEALAVLSAVATGNQLAVLKSAITALSNLADDSRQITLFDFSMSLEVGGNFQIGAAEANDNGAISMVMGAFYYRSDDQRKNILFFNWGSHDVQFWTSAQQMTLDTSFYTPLRDIVRDRLSAESESLIAKIPIS